MPWCEECSRYYTPSSLRDDGTCPTCGRPVTEPPAPGETAADDKAPWHFKLMVVALIVYLGWRFFEIFT